MNQDFEKWDVKELKKALERLGIDYSDCIEKKDLIEKLVSQTIHSNHNVQSSNDSSFSRRELSKRINGIECEILANNPQPDYIVFLFHGFGANADDLKDLARGFLDEIKEAKKVRFVLPEGLVTLGPQQHAWWPIDQMKLMMAIQTNDYSITEETPFGIDSVREKLSKLISSMVEECQQFNPKFTYSNNIILSGFSQGAMVSLDLSLHVKENPKGIALLSGGIICKNLWEQIISGGKLKGIKLFQSHGTSDPILPVVIGRTLNTLLKNSGGELTYHEFNSGHTIPLEIVIELAKFWLSLMD